MARLLLAAILVIVCLAMAEADTHSDCGNAETAFSFCVSYVVGEDPRLSSKCCMGLQIVKEITPSRKARQSICGCLKSLLAQVGRINRSRASGISSKCRVHTNVIPTSSSFDCTKIG